MGKFHFYFGLTIFMVFLLTGQYMSQYYNHLADMELMQRALFRAGHLYILLFGLINLSLGAYYQSAKNKTYQYIQLAGSTIIIFATGLCIYSFFTELPATQIERPLSRLSLYLILAGSLIHALAHFLVRNTNRA